MMADGWKMKPRCEWVEQQFVRMVDEDIEPELEAEIAAHFRGCRRCEMEWQAYRSAVDVLGSLDAMPVPDGMVERIRAEIERPRFWERIRQWIAPLPQRVPATVLAAVFAVVAVGGVWTWMSWSPGMGEKPFIASAPVATPRLPDQAIQQAAWNDVTTRRVLPGPEEIMSPLKALVEDQERRLSLEAVAHQDIVLDLSGSEEIFDQIQGILRETSGRMFLMGIRHRDSGRVVKSRMVLQIPFDHYSEVLERIESIGKVRHLFLDRDTVPIPPDRLRIRILGVTAHSQLQDSQKISHE